MEGNTTSLQFVLNDHLGSIQLLTDEQGNLIEEYSYDAWGMRRDPYTFDPILSGSSQIAYGFTGHEQLDLFKLVNMNGRMYDPVIGRFMSPDPVLQFPDFSQGLNPYSYVLNNPLRYTDPSGYSLVGQLAAIAASIAFSGGNIAIAAAIYASVMTVDYVIERKFKINIGQIFEYYTQTFVVTTIQAGGSLVIGGVIGNVGKLGREILRATAHGTFNGTMRMVQGGKFEHGFLSGFVSSLGGSAMQSYGTSMSTADKIVLSSVIGGTAEALGGGKFANGAVTGAFVMAFNHLMEPQTRPGRSPLNKKQIEVLKEKIKMATLKHRASWAKYDGQTMDSAPYWEESFAIEGVEYGDVYSAEDVEIWLGKETLNVDIDYFPSERMPSVNMIAMPGSDYTSGGRIQFSNNSPKWHGIIIEISFPSMSDVNKYNSFIIAHELK